MHTVAGSAVGRGQVAPLQRQAMKALDVGREHIRRQPILCDDPLGCVALAAGLWDVGWRNPRSGQFDGCDRVFAMAIRADRRIADAGCNRLAVDAPRVSLANIVVAFAARGRNGLPVQLRLRIG